MNASKKQVMEKKIARTLENLKKNNMQAIYAEKKEDVVPLVEKLMKEGDSVTVGGSVTLEETGVLDLLKSGKYRYLDRHAKGITPEEKTKIFRSAFTCDVYISGTNAVTENGELYNVDANGNRVAAMIYGPESVILVAGYNKIVKDVEEAVARVKNIAAPANCIRLNNATPCTKTGYCMSCRANDRICCSYVVSAFQKAKDRIKVILVGEELGY